MPDLILLHTHPAVSRLISEVVTIATSTKWHMCVHRVPSFPKMMAKVRGTRHPLLIVDPWYDGSWMGPQLVALLSDWTVPIVAISESVRRRLRDVARLGEAGLTDWITIGIDDSPEHLLKTIAAAVPRPGVVRVMREFVAESGRDEFLLSVLPILANGVEGPLTVPALARRLHVSERSLRRGFEARGLPGPNWWLRWSRVWAATSMIESGVGSRSYVATVLSFGSPSNLRRAATLLTGSAKPACTELLELAREKLAAGNP